MRAGNVTRAAGPTDGRSDAVAMRVALVRRECRSRNGGVLAGSAVFYQAGLRRAPERGGERHHE
jgi:N-acetylglucosamine-6-phosphate deacetylase